MNQKLRTVLEYIVERAKEASTWAGLAPILLLAHVHLSGDSVIGVTALGVFLAGAAAAAMKG